MVGLGNLDFQKSCSSSIVKKETPAPDQFVPYKFGAFSFTSYADRRKLVERRLLADDETVWTLTGLGRRSLGTRTSAAIATFAATHGRLKGDALVADTYRRFPYDATRSEIAQKVLKGDSNALQRIADARPSRSAGLSTIGDQGLSLEGYLNRLLQAGVTLLCHVRRNPLSPEVRVFQTGVGQVLRRCRDPL